MTKRVMIGAVCATLFAGATTAGAKPHEGDHPDNGNHGSSAAAKLCAASKKADHAAFKAVWGKHAMRDCIRANRGTEPTAVDDETTDFVNAARQCRDERDADPAAFQTTWGTNDNQRNAFGKCVSTTAQEQGGEGGSA
jgi:hypothetical protein